MKKKKLGLYPVDVNWTSNRLFFWNHHMENITKDYNNVRRQRADKKVLGFQIDNNTCIEIRASMVNLYSFSWCNINHAIKQLEKYCEWSSVSQKIGQRMILLWIYQHGADELTNKYSFCLALGMMECYSMQLLKVQRFGLLKWK